MKRNDNRFLEVVINCLIVLIVISSTIELFRTQSQFEKSILFVISAGAAAVLLYRIK